MLTETSLKNAGYKKVWEDKEFSAWKFPLEEGEPQRYFGMLHKGLGWWVMNNYESLEDLLGNLDWARNYVSSGKLEEEMKAPHGELGEKTYFGEKVSGRKVLDLGAGSNPDSRATHAVDLRKPVKEWRDVEYKVGVDLDKEKLPYEGGKFDMVVSHGSLGKNFGTKKTYKEIRRILKPGGELRFSFGFEDPKEYQDIVEELKGVGFSNVEVKTDKDTVGITAEVTR